VPSCVTVVSVAEPLYRNVWYTEYADPGEEDAHRDLLDRATPALRRRGVAAATFEPIGATAGSIPAAAHDGGADLSVVDSRHRGFIRRLLFGSVSAEMVVEAPCDVLVVH
jgi:nucleotide-binding universal stress UspA family protein